MRRYSPPRYSPPRRGYEGRGRSPPRRGYGRRRELNHGSLLVRNVPLDCRPEELRVSFERFGPVRDVYLPKDYYSGEPRGFAFIEFVDPHDAADAHYRMNGEIFGGRKLTVVVAAETRKRPQDMRRKRGPANHGGGRRGYHGRSRSRSVSRSRSPHPPPGSRARKLSRSLSPVLRRHGDCSRSPSRRDRHREELSRSPREPPLDDRVKPEQKEEHFRWRSSRLPSGSRSRSADLSPAR